MQSSLKQGLHDTAKLAAHGPVKEVMKSLQCAVLHLTQNSEQGIIQQHPNAGIYDGFQTKDM